MIASLAKPLATISARSFSRSSDQGGGIFFEPEVLSYATGQGLADWYAIHRINEFVKETKALGLTILDAVFLGEGMNHPDTPVTFIGQQTAIAPFTTGTVKGTHGYIKPARVSGDVSAIFPMVSAVGAEYTMVQAFNGDNYGDGYAFMGGMLVDADAPTVTRMGIYHNNGGMGENSGSDVGTLVLNKVGGAGMNLPTGLSGYRSYNMNIATITCVDAVSYNAVINDAALPSPILSARFYSGILDAIGFGKHRGCSLGAVVFDSALTDSQRLAVHALAKRTIFGSNVHWVFEGDSQIYGMEGHYPPFVGRMLMGKKWSGGAIKYTNISWGGEDNYQFLQQALAGSLNVGIPTATAPRTWLGLYLSGNRYLQPENAPELTVSYIGTMARMAKELGYEKVIAFTCFFGPASVGAPMAHTQIANDLLRNRNFADQEYVDEIIDMDVAFRAFTGVEEYWNIAENYIDGVHPTGATNQLIANYLNEAEVANPTRRIELLDQI